MRITWWLYPGIHETDRMHPRRRPDSGGESARTETSSRAPEVSGELEARSSEPVAFPWLSATSAGPGVSQTYGTT
jgi:hypothetical protein